MSNGMTGPGVPDFTRPNVPRVHDVLLGGHDNFGLAPDVAIYTFKVAGLPGHLPRYGFTVGKGRGTTWVPLSQVKDPGLTLESLS
jgi:hypothetical protein